jgi:lysozyme family protein
MSRMTRESIIADKTAVEAGYVNDPNDLGGETNCGITKETAYDPAYRDLWDHFGWDGNMKTLPKELAYAIYTRGWWNKMLLDDVLEFYPMLADRLFDFAINAGRVNCGKAFQRVLNALNRQQKDYPDLVVDGGVGNVTIQAFKAYVTKNGAEGAAKLTMMMFSMQNYHYVAISEAREKNETFTNGWVNRVWRDFKIYADSLF